MLSKQAREVLQVCINADNPFLTVWFNGIAMLGDNTSCWVFESGNCGSADDSLIEFGHKVFFEIGLLGVIKWRYRNAWGSVDYDDYDIDVAKCRGILGRNDMESSNLIYKVLCKCKHCSKLVRPSDNSICDDCLSGHGVHCQTCDMTYHDSSEFCSHVIPYDISDNPCLLCGEKPHADGIGGYCDVCRESIGIQGK